MREAGRILHHLRNNIEDGRNTVLITGFQAENTLGRKLADNWTEVRIFGEPKRVRRWTVYRPGAAMGTRTNCWPGWSP